jgi:WD40 repeat protein
LGQGILACSRLDVRPANPYSWQAHDGSVLGVAFLPDSQSLLSAATDGLVKHWSLTGELLRTIDWQIGELGAVAIAPDGLTAAVGGAEDIVVWDLEA